MYVTEGYTAQAIPFDPERARKNRLPEKICQMKALPYKTGSGQAGFYFYTQAEFMADYTDDSVYDGVFHRYYPTYTAMTNAQLRGYFGWRTRFRAGHPDPDVPLSFVYVHIYELLGRIGVTAMEGYEELRKIDRIYGPRDSALHTYLHRWTGDYIAYYDLDKAVADEFFSRERDASLTELEAFTKTAPEILPGTKAELPEETDTAGLFRRICALSSYKIERSPLVKKAPEDAEKLYVYVIYAVAGMLKHEHRRFIDRYFGVRDVRFYRMFQGAVFFDRKFYRDYTYRCPNVRTYHCVEGQWSVENYAADGKSEAFARLCREIDRQARLQFRTGRPLKASSADPATEKLVADLVGQYIREKEEAARPKISIDMSVLGRIRRDAAVTRDSLLVEEENTPTDLKSAGGDIPSAGTKDAEEISTGEPADRPGQTGTQVLRSEEKTADASAGTRRGLSTGTQAHTESPEVIQDWHSGMQKAGSFAGTGWFSGMQKADLPAVTGGPDGLSADERFFLHALLYGESWTEYVRDRHLMISMLADSINEKMMDEIGDTVIEFDGETPEIVEDYRTDLEMLIPR